MFSLILKVSNLTIMTAFNTLLKPTKDVEIKSLSFTCINIWSDLDENYIKANIEFEHEGKKYAFEFVERQDNDEERICACKEIKEVKAEIF